MFCLLHLHLFFEIMTSGDAVNSGCKTRFRHKAFNADRDFAPSQDLQPSTKLPFVKSVIGMLRYHMQREGKGTVANAMTTGKVAKQVYAKYFHDTIFCVSAVSPFIGGWRTSSEHGRVTSGALILLDLAILIYPQVFIIQP